jgi:hypothetical protein
VTPRRKPALSRETLRDLSLSPAQARTVRGADTKSYDVACDLPLLGPRRIDRTTTSISGENCGPGIWRVDYRVLVEHQVYSDGTVEVRSVRTYNEPPEQIGERPTPID